MRKQTLEEFKAERSLVHRGKGVFRNSYGVYDYYKYYRKNREKGSRWKITEKDFYDLVRQVNQILAEELIEKGKVDLPHKMGTLEFQKVPRQIYQDKNGNYKTNQKIDWSKTFELWYEDDEAYKNKTLVRFDRDDLTKFHYRKVNAEYVNKTFYTFLIQKELAVAFIKRRPNGFNDIPQVYTKDEFDQIKGLYDG